MHAPCLLNPLPSSVSPLQKLTLRARAIISGAARNVQHLFVPSPSILSQNPSRSTRRAAIPSDGQKPQHSDPPVQIQRQILHDKTLLLPPASADAALPLPSSPSCSPHSEDNLACSVQVSRT